LKIYFVAQEAEEGQGFNRVIDLTGKTLVECMMTERAGESWCVIARSSSATKLEKRRRWLLWSSISC